MVIRLVIRLVIQGRAGRVCILEAALPLAEWRWDPGTAIHPMGRCWGSPDPGQIARYPGCDPLAAAVSAVASARHF
jgi:hypothetical protein